MKEELLVVTPENRDSVEDFFTHTQSVYKEDVKPGYTVVIVDGEKVYIPKPLENITSYL